MRTTLLTAAAAAVLALTAAGCSSTPDTTTSASQPGVVFNDADVTFATQMYPHHAQAVEMADLVDGRTTTPAVVALAAMITGEQAPEMDTMTTLLTSWGKPVPSSSMTDMSAMGDSSMPGMMTDDEMTSLRGLTGTAFDTAWLTMMTAHHEGAVTMAATELADGSSADAKALATSITTAQKAEIATMAGLLAG